MDMKEFSAVNRARSESPAGFNHLLASWSLSDWMTGLMGELGEAANVAKKLNRVRDGVKGNEVLVGQSPAELRQKLTHELADVFIYLDLTCQYLGVDLADAVIETWNEKSRQLGYPVRL